MAFRVWRRLGQRVLIGDSIMLEVHAVRGHDQVELLIVAPHELKIDRAEVREIRRRRPSADTPSSS